MQKAFDGEQVYHEKHLKIEVKLGKTNGGKKKLLLTDSIVKIDKNYYSQIF